MSSGSEVVGAATRAPVSSWVIAFRTTNEVRTASE